MTLQLWRNVYISSVSLLPCGGSLRPVSPAIESQNRKFHLIECLHVGVIEHRGATAFRISGWREEGGLGQTLTGLHPPKGKRNERPDTPRDIGYGDGEQSGHRAREGERERERIEQVGTWWIFMLFLLLLRSETDFPPIVYSNRDSRHQRDHLELYRFPSPVGEPAIL